MYDDIAKGYNELHGEEQLKKARIILENMQIKETDLLLDVGCGTGIATELFNCKKIGIDNSFEMLRKAKVPVVQAKAEALPFKDNSFDIVISITAIHNFDDIEKALKEMKRVGKSFAFSVLKKAARFDFIKEKIEEIFKVNKVVEDEKDLILIVNYKY